MTKDGYEPVNAATLETRFPGVYAIGDVATTGVPKAVEPAWRGRAAERGDPPGVPKRVGL